jgi:transcriptional regulator with XRE-family HTH domain
LTAKKPTSSSYVREPRTLGDHLRRKRILLGLRQSDVAAHVAISPSALERWERNETEPKPYLIPRIIDFLGYAPWTAPQTFGEWLRLARRANGFSRKRLAQRLRVDESTVFRWEAGTTNPTPGLLDRITCLLRA